MYTERRLVYTVGKTAVNNRLGIHVQPSTKVTRDISNE